MVTVGGGAVLRGVAGVGGASQSPRPSAGAGRRRGGQRVGRGIPGRFRGGRRQLRPDPLGHGHDGRPAADGLRCSGPGGDAPRRDGGGSAPVALAGPGLAGCRGGGVAGAGISLVLADGGGGVPTDCSRGVGPGRRRGFELGEPDNSAIGSAPSGGDGRALLCAVSVARSGAARVRRARDGRLDREGAGGPERLWVGGRVDVASRAAGAAPGPFAGSALSRWWWRAAISADRRSRARWSCWRRRRRRAAPGRRR